MHKTQFAGLTAPDPNDAPLQVDGGSFTTRNPDITDHFLQIGAVTHRHDEHPALADPTVAASAAIDTTTGSIPSGSDIYVGYTLIDEYGGETRISPVVNATTPAELAAPSIAFDAEFDPSAGVLPVGSYYYAITMLDAGGGETTIGPSVLVTRPSGTANGQINFTGLAAELGPDGGALWRLWRADNGGQFNLIAAGTDDTFTDPGIDPVDHAATPPTTSRATHSTNTLTVTMPDATAEPLLTGPLASAFALYVSDDGAFSNPCLYEVYPVASAGASIVISDLTVQTGAPPDVSRSIPGAHKITAAELADDVVLGGGGGGGGGGLVIQDHGSPEPVRANLSFEGALGLWDDGDVIHVSYGRQNRMFERFLYGDYATFETRNMADWGTSGEAGADAAGDDGRVRGLGALDDLNTVRNEVRIVTIGADDLVGGMVKMTGLDDFLIGQVNNTSGAPTLEVAYASAGVLTTLASAAVAPAVDGMVLVTEVTPDRSGDFMLVGVALYPVDTELSFAAPVAQVAARVHWSDPAFHYWSVTDGRAGLRVLPAAGGGNTLRVSNWSVEGA